MEVDEEDSRKGGEPGSESAATVQKNGLEKNTSSELLDRTEEAQPVLVRPSSPHSILHPQPSSPMPPKSPDTSSRALNVTDALSYLDAVKTEFHNQPEVYNRFLDIMKDFKSQVIDTPGVIQRVSQLFQGNRMLIQGFNTFLPNGYRIDVSRNTEEPYTITVTTPQGTQTTNSNFVARREPTHFAPTPTLPPIAGSSSRSRTPTYHHQSQFEHPAPQLLPPVNVTAYPPAHSRTSEKAQQPPGEFNHAMQYLNKIKARYADDPGTYKQFLDILQQYQKEQKHLHESQVHVQVQHLFKDAPDLLGEFKAFLPEISAGQNMVVFPQPPSLWPQPDVPERSKKSTQPPAKRKKKAEKDTTPVPPAKPAARPTKKAKHHHKPEPGSPSSLTYVGHSPPPTHMPPPAMSQQQIQQQPLPAGTDKLLFFDRAKKTLENRQMYDDFLKLLSLFSKEVIDMKTLIARTQDAFLGDGELMDEFKELVGWDDQTEEKGPPGSVRTGPPEALSALPMGDGEGPSYRRLPDSEARLACSGRDELCRSVLNDEWVSHPTWASEDAGFVSHKKNSFEEALHKSEDERHEFHVQITALGRTIAHFEPLALRIDEMSGDERASFRLKSDFGGSGKYLYHRIIKKIYGRDGGNEIISALQDQPAVTVPLVLMRLKQKDEEWRRAQREWSRTWREVDAKNFYKSLDHQGINFKQNDKKNITAKYFVADIEAQKSSQDQGWSGPSPAPPQLEFTFADISVLHDALKMVYSFLDHAGAQYSALERRGMETWLRRFVPLLCQFPAVEFNAACGPIEGMVPDDPVEPPRSGRRSTGSAYSASIGGVHAGDLRKKLLKTAQEKNDLAAVSRAESPVPPDDTETWIKETTHLVPEPVNGHSVSSKRPFFANTTFYTLFRLLQLLYSRLESCKIIGARLADEQHMSLLANPVAAALGLDDPAGPPVVLAQTVLPLAASLPPGSSQPANVVYMYLLHACEKVFDNDLDQLTFEEHMRWFFGEKAYHLFTLDKVIAALVKQVQQIIGDNKCQELWTSLQNVNAVVADGIPMTDTDIVRYRREAERYVGQDDHLYRMEWVRETKTMRVFLVSNDDPSVNGGDRWREYVSTYVMRHPTEWIPLPPSAEEDDDRIPPTTSLFLKRTRSTRDVDRATLVGESMCVRIQHPTYKIVYEAGTEDVIWSSRVRVESRVNVAMERRRQLLAERFA
ncbi:Histone deacetylase complex, SIN3 component [Mycena indigotica]|uniref:Histone deacetylase complex, SIN3 component n=1 Tax=Mycena indigotica TaxID=2126181 RepID=A0A8H6WH44_9AGAR|nr:Histone deacetylase complex, SIN3 component [Mycena indigotica]KAF7312114.1 Histone deacetylase complex, SIN3 component [Mycena indigotica]